VERKRGNQKTRVGTVVSDRMEKTVVVMVERKYLHPMYKKYVQQRQKYKTHDPLNSARIGDRVVIEETRPLSKDKRWKLKEIVQRAPVL